MASALSTLWTGFSSNLGQGEAEDEYWRKVEDCIGLEMGAKPIAIVRVERKQTSLIAEKEHVFWIA